MKTQKTHANPTWPWFSRRSRALLASATIALTGSAHAQLTATLTDYGATPPTPGVNDISQLSVGGGNPPGLNYYFDNGAPPGQTLTTGANANGYVMNSLYIATAGGGGQLPGAGQTYTLRLYTVSGTNATLIASYLSQPGFTFVETDWLEWSGLGFGLQPNTQYAYTLRRNSAGWENMANVAGNPYAGGQAALIPTGGGVITFSTSPDYDASFSVALEPATSIVVNPPTFSPSSAVSPGATVTISTAPAVGPGPLSYQWQTDGGTGGTLTNIPGATSSSLVLNTTGYALGKYRYVVVVNNNSTSATSAEATLTVFQSGPGTIADVGTVITPGFYDISQLSGGGNGDGLNYYHDNAAPPGQTFTTGTNSQGYWLTSVTIGTGGGGSSGTLTAQPMNLYIYTVDGGTATLIAHYTNSSFAFTYGNWIRWSSFAPVFLKSNATYAYTFARNPNGSGGSGWAGLTSTPGSSDLYDGGQLVTIPREGGQMVFGNSGMADGAFDLGLTPIGIGPNPIPFANPIVISPSSIVLPGTQLTLTESATGAAPLYHQWRTDGASGGALTNIPGATGTNLVLNTTGWAPGAYRFAVLVTNSFGSVTSAVSTVTLLYANTTALLEDIGMLDPDPRPAFDLFQLDQGGGNPDGLNYYLDNGAPPGQTFITGNNPGGYTLTSLAIDMGTGSTGGLPAGGQAYILRIYKISNNTNATLYAVYTSATNFTFTHSDWLRWSGLALPLNAGSTYAYTFARDPAGSGWENLSSVGGNLYADGEVALIPANGGTVIYGGSHDFDGTFILGLASPGFPYVSPPSLSIREPFAGSPVTATATVTGTGPFTYQWQTDGGFAGVLTNIPGATSITLPIDTTGMDGLTVAYRLIASNGAGSTTGEVSFLVVAGASGPNLVTDTTPASATGFVGQTLTFRATFNGTLPLSYQWQVDKGQGLVDIPGQTNSTLTLTNLQLSDAGSYSLFVTNSLGTGASTPAVLTVGTVPTLTTQLSGNQLTLNWPANNTGWTLQVQTNSLAVGLSNNWVTVQNSTNANSHVITVSPGNGAVFYRLVYP